MFNHLSLKYSLSSSLYPRVRSTLVRQKAFLITGVLCLLLSACGGGGGGGSKSGGTTPGTAQLLEIEVTPVDSSIALDAPAQFKATGRFDDDSVFDITSSVNWTSSNTGIATIDTTVAGRINPVAPGKTDITASLGSLSSSTQLTVNDATLQSLHIIPDKVRFAAGEVQALTVTGKYSDGSERDITPAVTWSTGDGSIASVLTSKAGNHYVVGVSPGTTIVNATLSGIPGFATVNVTDAKLTSVEITLDNATSLPAEGATLAKGTQLQLHAYGTYSDTSVKDITITGAWSVLDTTIAAISTSETSAGLVTGLKAGTSSVQVSFSQADGSSIAATVALTVTDAVLQSIDITPSTANITENLQQAFTATGHYSDGTSQAITSQVLWSSSNSNALTISNANGEHGIARALMGPATVTVTAQMQSNSGTVSNTANVTVVKPDPTAPVAVYVTANPDLIYYDGNDSTTLTAIVQAADSTQYVADNTVVEFAIVDGKGNLGSTTALTSNGKAQVILTSSSVGTVKVKATVQGTSIENYVLVSVTNDFASTLVVQASQSVTQNGDGSVATGSSFTLITTNYSSRVFDLVSYYFYSGTGTSAIELYGTMDLSAYSGGKMPTGALTSISYSLGTDNTNLTYTGILTLHDPATDLTFQLSHVFTVQ